MVVWKVFACFSPGSSPTRRLPVALINFKHRRSRPLELHLDLHHLNTRHLLVTTSLSRSLIIIIIASLSRCLSGFCMTGPTAHNKNNTMKHKLSDVSIVSEKAQSLLACLREALALPGLNRYDFDDCPDLKRIMDCSDRLSYYHQIYAC